VRRLLTFTAAWLFAAVAATTAAWQGVSLVTHEVTDDRPAALAASDVQSKLDDAAATAPATSTTGSRATPGSTATTTTPPPTTPAVQPVRETYQLEGGVVTIQFSPTEVRAVGVTPNQGFSVKKSEPEDGGWRVEFESDSHRSRLDAWWDGGPQFRTREDPH
jgi:hypothetical protein